MEKRVEGLEEAWELMNIRLDQIHKALEHLVLQLPPWKTRTDWLLEKQVGSMGKQGGRKFQPR